MVYITLLVGKFCSEYERLDQPVHTHETLVNQDERKEEKPEHNGASMSYMPSD